MRVRKLLKESAGPPVTSHIWVMADSSVGTLPSCSLSGVAAPGSRSTRANSLWSQRKGSLVSSLPASGELRGRCSCRTDRRDTDGVNEDGASEAVTLLDRTVWVLFWHPHLVGDPGAVRELVPICDRDDHRRLQEEGVTALRRGGGGEGRGGKQ